MKRLIISTLLYLFFPLNNIFSQFGGQIETPGKCLSYTIEKNCITFACEQHINVKLKVCSSGIIKISYEQDGITKNQNSFAVISDSIENINKINISEQPQSFEIYTGELIVRVDKSPFRIRFFDKYQKLLLEDYQDRGYLKEHTHIASYKTLRSNEQFFGLGEKSGSFNRRGKSYRMWNSDKPCYEVNEDPLYKSIPFFISSYGYGIFFDNTYKTEFKFGSESTQYYSFESQGGEMVYYFIFGPEYKQMMQRYVDLTGKPIIPPAWALGFSQCRGLLVNEKLTREIASEYRKRKIPCDIIYQDIGWVQNLQDFEWKKQNYTDPQKMVNDLRKEGFKIIVSQDPVISQSNQKQWHEADSLGYFTTDIRTGKTYDMPWPWGGNCGIVDFTRPETSNWWGTYQQKVLNNGVRGFWTDMGEPAWSNEENTDRLYMRHYLGMHDKIHNVYGLTWDKVVTEQFEKHNPNQRIFQMTRSGFSGMQRYTFGWSGDSGDGYNVLNGWNKLTNQLQMGISAGLGAIPFWSCDISGYCGDIKDYESFSELYVRWLQFGVFNPLSRAHHEGNNAVEPWLFGTEAERICRNAIELKYKLHPYIYTYAREAFDTGLPIMRAMLLEYPDDPESLNMASQFMFGKELLVAPVTEKGAETKKVYLPEGKWIDFNDGITVYQGNQWISYKAPLNTIPIFVKEGSIIPMMPVMQYINQSPNHPVELDIYAPGENKSIKFDLYEDDGESNNYKKNMFCKTTIHCLTAQKLWKININKHEENEYKSVRNRNWILKIHVINKPSNIIVNNKNISRLKLQNITNSLTSEFQKSNWDWDEKSKICYIKIPDIYQSIEIVASK